MYFYTVENYTALRMKIKQLQIITDEFYRHITEQK